MNTLAERLRYAMEVLPPKKIKGVDLARAVGVKPPSVSDWLSGKSKTMEGENLLRAAKHLNVNPLWLASGTGSPTTQIDTSQNAVYLSPVEFKTSYENRNTVSIPVHKNVKAACGEGVANFLEEITGYVEIDPNFLKMLGINSKPEKLRVIYSTDYSMWPTVAPDSPLFVDVSTIDTDTIINGDVYVFLHNNFLRMKRVFISYGDERTVRLQSDNPDKKKYPDEVITKEQLNELSFVGRLESALVKP